MRIAVEGVHKSWPLSAGAGTLTVLNGVDLTVASGECCLIQGPSGSGKTTLLNIIAGLSRPTAGRVLLDGAAERPAAGAIACGFQEPLFVAELNVQENLLLPAIVGGLPVSGRRVEQLLEEFGLAEMFDLFPSTLSGGEKRRLTLARALLLPSPLLLIDEPAAYLDEEWSRRVMEIVLREVRSRGATLLVATHITLPGMEADRMVRIERGRVTADGC